jgi:hypothetical protein
MPNQRAGPPDLRQSGSWTFIWRAPGESVSRTFVSGNAANGSNTNQGDYIYNTSRAFSLPGVCRSLRGEFCAKRLTTAESIATTGDWLADATAGGALTPPTTLAGAIVRVKDAAGVERDAPLFFASPQINLLIPEGTGNGVATSMSCATTLR